MSNVLVIGSGSRECAIVKKLLEDASKINIKLEITAISTCTNPYLYKNTRLIVVPSLNIEQLMGLTDKFLDIEFAIIGPENPLEEGYVDYLESLGIPTIGPCQIFAKIETSKAYCRTFLERINLSKYSPTFSIIQDTRTSKVPEQVLKSVITSIITNHNKIVIKKDGLYGGKGVLVQDVDFNSKEEAIEYLSTLNEKGKIVIEDKLEGEEFSLMSLTDGNNNIQHFPPIQDYKRLLDNDRGKNTGGMGCIIDSNNTLPFLNKEDIVEAEKINEKVINKLNENRYKNNNNLGYRGILYGSYIKCIDGSIKIIEFNARFGDPECILALSLLKTNFYKICKELIDGRLTTKLEFEKRAMIGVYLVPTGYPSQPEPNYDIYIDKSINNDDITMGNVVSVNKHLYSQKSRALIVTQKGNSLTECYKNIYEKIKLINGHLFYRKDIGAKFLSSYEKAGVSITTGNTAIKEMKQYVEKTYNKNVLGKHGDFGGQYKLDDHHKILVASIDGVGTKSILVARRLGDEGFISLGKDIVNHSVNDILVQGAYPLFFLDYFGTSHLKVDEITNFVRGISDASIENGNIPLLGGETAEMPAIYKDNKTDLVGCIIGYKDERFFNNTSINKEDILVCFKSEGPHTNGYSLINNVIKEHEPSDDILKMLLKPHKSYLNEIKEFVDKFGYDSLKGMCHITGGGLYENLDRIIPKDIEVVINNKLNLPEWCEYIKEKTEMSEDEMYRVFNCGIGFVLIIDKSIKEQIELEKNITIIGYLQ